MPETPTPTLVHPGAQRAATYNEGLVVYLYDVANRAQAVRTQALTRSPSGLEVTEPDRSDGNRVVRVHWPASRRSASARRRWSSRGSQFMRLLQAPGAAQRRARAWGHVCGRGGRCGLGGLGGTGIASWACLRDLLASGYLH